MLGLSLHNLDSALNAWANHLLWPLEPFVRLLLAAILGALVGIERETRGRQAGFRTNLLLSLGCALVMIVSVSFAYQHWPTPIGFNINVDPARVAYGVMTGIGFLGAGAIIKQGNNIRGLTTAAGLWCVAAIGLACGLGLYLVAIIAALLVLAALWGMTYFERLLPRTHYRTITLRRKWSTGVIRQTITLIEQGNRTLRDVSFRRAPDLSTVEIRLQIAFTNRQQYLQFEDELDHRPDCDVISASSES